MAQYVMSMLRVSKIVPPKKTIIKDISLSFFPGAKIGLLGLNGSGKSTVLRIMAGVDKEYEGEVQHQPNLAIGYLPQEPQLDPEKTVREEVESGMGEVMQAQAKLEAVYAAYAEPDADFDKLAEEQAKYENIIAASGADLTTQLDIAADALRLPPWDAKIGPLSGGEKRRVAATITAHHLLLNRNDMFKGGILPHHYCLPILKREQHRLVLVQAATSGNAKFFLGTDSAPHAKSTKENACGCAGMYTAHTALELYAEAFDRADALDKLEGFASFYGADFYGLARNTEQITLVKESWTVPTSLPFADDALVPLWAGQTLHWKLSSLH